MVTPGREEVIENIKRNVLEGKLNAKVETGDPVLSDTERREIIERYLKVRRTPLFLVKNWAAGRMADIATWSVNRKTEITGLENIKGLKGGAFITANHFNPTENTAYRLLSQKMRMGNLYVISQDTNLKMGGIFGFFMYYMNIIPISPDLSYMTKHFDSLIDEAFRRKQNILVYPEQEMWFNYRKPRPLKRGAYYYAARHGRPVIPCFTEIIEEEEMETDSFRKTRWVVHVMEPIYPDPSLSVRENSMRMQALDFEAKKAAYEKAYGKPLDYTYSDWDIAGYVPGAARG